MKHVFKFGIIAAMLCPAPLLAQNAGHVENATGGASCPACNLFQADFSFKDMPGRNFAKAKMRQSNLSLSTMNNAKFDGADLSVSNMFGGRFSGAGFRYSNLQNATMVGGYFGGADFKGANLTGANLSGADLQTARINQAQLNKACGDQYTLLPARLTIKPCK